MIRSGRIVLQRSSTTRSHFKSKKVRTFSSRLFKRNELVPFQSTTSLTKWKLKWFETISTHTEISSVEYSHSSSFFDYSREGQRASFLEKAQRLGSNDLDMLITLATTGEKPSQIIRLSPAERERNVHQYVQIANLGVQPLLSPERAGEVLLDQFMRFPSVSSTKLSKDRRKAILNLGDHVTLSALHTLEHGGYRVFYIEARTESVHALAGQLDHMLFQNIATGESYLVRPGVGHLLGLNTPGAGLLDHANDFVGGFSWVLASRFAPAVIAGDARAIAKLERAYGVKLAKVFFTAGGILSRSVVQPIQRITFRRTPETVFAAYLVALLVLLFAFSAYASETDDEDEDDELRKRLARD